MLSIAYDMIGSRVRPTGGIIAILLIIALIATIALSIIWYKKFLGKDAQANRRTSWGRFFNFDHLYLNKILKGLFLIEVVAIIVFSVLTPFFMAAMSNSVGGGFIGFLLGILIGIASLAIGLFLTRIQYEFIILIVRFAVDVRHIRESVVGTPGEEQDESVEPLLKSLLELRPQGTTQATRLVRTTSTATMNTAMHTRHESEERVVQEPSNPGSTAEAIPQNMASWVCGTCGATNKAGNFCGSCGSPRN